MNYFDLLKWIQDFRSQLEVWGVNSEILWFIGTIAFVGFILSTREVMSWYLRTNQVRDELRSLRAEIAELRRLVIENREEPVTAAPADQRESDKAVSKTFRLGQI